VVYADLGTNALADRIVVATEWNEKDLISSVPGARWNTTLRQWTVPKTYTSVVILRGVFGKDLKYSQKLSDHLWEVRRSRVDPAMFLRDKDTYDDTTATLRDDLFPFQKAAVEFMSVAGSGLLGDEMGCGKTIELLSLLEYNSRRGVPTFPALIICPSSLKTHWAERATQWLQIPVTPIVVDGPLARRRKILASVSEQTNPIVIINLEAVRSFSRLAPFGSIRLSRCLQCDPVGGNPELTPAKCEVHAKELNTIGFRTVIVDEAHRLKDPKSKQTRATWAVCHDSRVETRWVATGTPIVNSVNDLWSVMHTVAPDEYPGRSKFTDRYAVKEWSPFGGMVITGIRPDTSDELQKFFKPRFRRMQKSVVLKQLPPKTHVVRTVAMTRSQQRMYDDFKTSLSSLTDDGELIIVKSELAVATRLAQLAVASLDVLECPDADNQLTWKVRLKEPSPKIDELVVLLEELGEQQAVVVADHSQLIDLAYARLRSLGIRCGKITGDVCPVDRNAALVDFNQQRTRVLLFTARAGGVGLDMSVASQLIFLQHPWSMVDYKQAEDRVHRIGSERHEGITITHIVTSGTIEDAKMSKLEDKLRKLEEITRDREALCASGADTTELDSIQSQIIASQILP
jgi:SNF2 family DNA or RNA helicase